MGQTPEVRTADCSSPLISVVVVTHNSRPHLNDLLASLRAQTLQCFELLVLDSASTDGTLAALRKRWGEDKKLPTLRCIAAASNLGYREGNRNAIRQSRGKYLLVLNDDVELHPRMLEELVVCAEGDSAIAMVAPAILMHGSASQLNAAGSDLLASGFYAARAKNESLEQYEQAIDIAAVSGCAFLVRRDALDDPGGFAGIYGELPSGWHASAEDLDLCWRVLAKGGRIRYQPRAILWHKYQQKALTPQRFSSLIGGRMLFVGLNFPRPLLMRLAPLLLLTESALVLYVVGEWIRSGRPEHLHAWWKNWVFILGRRELLRELRAQRQRATTRRPAQLAGYFATHLPLNPVLKRRRRLRAGIRLWFLANRCFRRVACLGVPKDVASDNAAWEAQGESVYTGFLLYRIAKRSLDVAGAVLLMLATAPAMAVIALLVRVRLGSPVLFRQTRTGFRERPFTLMKFRTMTDIRDDKGDLLPDGERLPRFGQWLRAWSLDELPQLWNILRGDMSFIGPRPLLPEYLPRYTQEQRIRHAALPGLSGLAQVNGRNATTWQRRLELDALYVRQANLWLDLRLAFETVGTLCRRRGISQPGQATMPEFLGVRLDV